MIVQTVIMSYFREEGWREGEVRFARYITCMTTSVWRCLPVLDSKSEMETDVPLQVSGLL